MQTRFSTVAGAHIVEEQSMECVGFLRAPLIDPDTGIIVGFFVLGAHPDAPVDAFVASADIIAWGTSVHIRSLDVLSPPEDLIRLRGILHDDRRVLGQTIMIRGTRRTIGRCADVQFDTRRCALQWIFPRRFWIYRRPIAVTEIEEITPEAIWIADPLRGISEQTVTPSSSGVLAPLLESTQPA